MKVRDLKRKTDNVVVSVWPPMWGGSYGPGAKFPVGEQGVLTGVKAINGKLSLTIKYDGRDHSGVLEWDEPPTLAPLEAALKAHIGKTIKAVADVEIK